MTSSCDAHNLKERRADQVVFISVMGLQESGLAIAVGRYADSLSRLGIPSEAIVISTEDHREQAHAKRVRSFEELDEYLLRATNRGTTTLLVWVGLHSDADALARQLRMMARWDRTYVRMALVPERTGFPGLTCLEDLRRLSSNGTLERLIHFNGVQDGVWSRQLTISSDVIPPPVPDEFFQVARDRLNSTEVCAEVCVVYVGRMSRRKRVSDLVRNWGSWRRSLESIQLRPTLRLYGKQFEGEENDWQLPLEDEPFGSLLWSHNFPGPVEMSSWPRATVGVSFSAQDFDAIAASELLAAGIPFVGRRNEGHVALSQKSSSVFLFDDEFEAWQLISRLLTRRSLHESASKSATESMRSYRSMQMVGSALKGIACG